MFNRYRISGMTLAVILLMSAVLMLVLTGIGKLSLQQSALTNHRARQADLRYASWSASQMALLQLSREPDRDTTLTGSLPSSSHGFTVEFFNNRTGDTALNQDGIVIPPGSVLLKSTGMVGQVSDTPMYSLAIEVVPRFEAAVFGDESIEVHDSLITARSEVAWEMTPPPGGPIKPYVLASRQQAGSGTGFGTGFGTGGVNPVDPGLDPGPGNGGTGTAGTDGGTDGGAGTATAGVGGGATGLATGGPGIGTGAGSGGTGIDPPGGGVGVGGEETLETTELAGLSTNSRNVGSIILTGTTTIDGDVKFGQGSDPQVSEDFSQRVAGEVSANEQELPLAPIRVPENSPPPSSTPASVSDLAAGPGRFGSFQAPPGAEVTLETGVYIFDGDVDFDNLRLNTSGAVKIYVSGDVKAKFASFSPAGSEAGNLQIFVIGEHEVDLEGTDGEAAFMGDSASFELEGVTLTGAVVGKSIKVESNSVVQYDERLETLEFDGASEWIQRSIVVGN